MLTAALVLIAVAVQAGEWEGTVVQIDGVEHVKNPAHPMQPEVVVEAARLWSIGGESDDELLGVIAAIVVDESGNTYMLDQQLSEVRVHGPDGGFIRTIGREGAGPGEFRQAMDLFLLPEDRLGVVQVMPARIVLFRLDGEVLPDLSVASDGMSSMITRVRAAADALVAQRQVMSFADNQVGMRYEVVRLNNEGETLSTLWENTVEISMTRMVIDPAEMSPALWDAANDGRVFVSAQYDAYTVEVYGADGDLSRVIERDYEALERTDEEIAELEQQTSPITSSGMEIEVKIRRRERDILQLRTRYNGELWVSSGRSVVDSADGVLGAWEVFNTEGRYVRNVRIAVDYREKRDTWFLVGDRLYVIKEGVGALRSLVPAGFLGAAPVADEEAGDLDPPEVICYSLTFPAE